MKLLITIISFSLLAILECMAQSPQALSYQAVLRDASNQLVINSAVSTQISILQGSATGLAVYVETHSMNTNSNGLLSTEIGTGTIVSGTFNTIDWSKGPYFILTETDPDGGNKYSITNASQILSVPYALHSQTAESVIGFKKLVIGDSYGGGIIFWLDSSGLHGLIAATEDQGTDIQWYNGDQTLTEASLSAVYAGVKNTAKNMDSMGPGTNASQLCADYSVIVDDVFYGDWYLPSKHELDLLYKQRAKVGGFANDYYWCSNEEDLVDAWRQSFGFGGQSATNKGFRNRVRAIRAF